MMRYILFLSSFFLLFLHAGTLEENLLSQDKRAGFGYDAQKVDAESRKLRDSWLNPITASFLGSFHEQYGYNQESYSGTVSIDQPIFKSGGIYFAIKYANATAQYNSLNVEIAKKHLIKEALSLMFQLKRIDLSIASTELQYQDAKATYEYNLEQFAAGEMDQARVNLNEITQNSIEISLLDLKNQRESLLYQLSLISNADYQSLKLPLLTLVEKQHYMKFNMDLVQLQSKNRQTRYFKNMTISKYLPSISATASYNYSKGVNQAFSEKFLIGDTESQYFQYGFRVSMPIFDINMLRDIESAKVDYLKSTVTYDEKKKESEKLYTMTIAKLKRIDRKIALAKKNVILYDQVLQNSQASYRSGDQTILDLSKAKHQHQIKMMEIKKYFYDKQIELLNLYEKLSAV